MADLPEDPEELLALSRPLGLLEVLGSGSGFVRRRESGYAPGSDDIYVSSAAADVAGPGALPQAGFARVTVLALDGREVATLLADEMTAGSHEVFWNGQDHQGRRMASGAYFYRLEAGGAAETGRMLLLK